MALTIFGGTGGGSGCILSGHGAPGSGSGLEDLDGVSDPWRWSDAWGGWVGPAFEVTWAEGDEVPGVDSEDDIHLSVLAGPGLVSTAFYEATSASAGVGFTTTDTGSGIAFVVQYEPDFTHTVVPDIDFEPDYGDLVVGDAYEFPEVSTGSDGQWYVDLDTRDVYGPRTDGDWTHFSTLPAPS